jgi:hypothetical protein
MEADMCEKYKYVLQKVISWLPIYESQDHYNAEAEKVGGKINF